MVKKSSILLIIIVFLVLFLQLKKVQFSDEYQKYQKYVPVYDLKDYPRSFLLYSKITPSYLLANIALFRDYNFQGFIISSLPSNWYSDVSELTAYLKQCQKINSKFSDNYLRIIIADNDLPEWQDEEAWVSVNNNIKKIVRFAKKSKFKGLLLDTTAYNKKIWNPGYYQRYQDLSEDLARKLIYQRGRDLITVIKEEYPDVDLMITPVGVLTKTKKDMLYHRYYYWVSYLNGILSLDDHTKYNLLTTKGHWVFDDAQYKEIADDVDKELWANLDYPRYWQQNGSLSFSLWPLGSGDYHKGVLVSSENFDKQLRLCQKYSTKYVVIISKGQAWWQTEEGDAYGLDDKEAKLKQHSKFVEYVAILNSFRDFKMKKYFESIKNNKKVSWLEFYLAYFFAILRK